MFFYNSFFYSNGKPENIPDNFRSISNNIFIHKDNKEHIFLENNNLGLFLLGNIFDPTILEHSRVKISKEVRIKNELINAIINMNCPSLLDIPIN